MRVVATDATITVDDARIRHKLFPVPSIALGRLLVGSLLMASTLKDQAVVSLTVKGDGPLSMITADASCDGYVRGYCSAPQLDVSIQNGEIKEIIGKGHLSVRKYIEQDGKPYTGIIELHTGEIGEDLAYYYYHSEQIPTAISIGVYIGKDGRVAGAGGILVQALPPQEESFLEKLETIFARSPAITSLTKNQVDAEGIVQAYLPGFDLERMESLSPMFRCSCGKTRTKRAIVALGKDDIKSLIAEGEKVDIVCDYCGQHYYYEIEDLEQILTEL